MMKVKALIIGCGNIGSQYDLNNSLIQTHSKAMFLSDWINEVDVFDLNTQITSELSQKYNFGILKKYNSNNLHNYDIISICTPTETHYKFLKDCILQKVKLVICEKPISFSQNELTKLLSLYNESSTKVLVNYYRRFQKPYNKLKEKIHLFSSDLSFVNIKYYKGVLNYASHAMDLINFIINKSLKIEMLNVLSRNFDYFKKDPTIIANFNSNGVEYLLNGVSSEIPVLDIELIFKNKKVFIFDLGNKANIYEGDILVESFDSMIDNYMLDVFEHAKSIFLNEIKIDNFKESLILNKQLLYTI